MFGDATRFIKLHLDDIINTTEFLQVIKNEILLQILKQELFVEASCSDENNLKITKR